MIKKFALLLIVISLLVHLPVSTINAQSDLERGHQEGVVEAKTLDPRAEILKNYLARYNSPLQYHAQDFVDAADEYGVDYKLVPAIAGVESTFGQQIPGGFNGWGWGVYGDNRIYFESWRHAIFTITKGIKEGYIDQGLTDPYSMNRKYASSTTWGSRVAYFMADIDQFAKTHQVNKPKIVINREKTLDQILLTSESKPSTINSANFLKM